MANMGRNDACPCGSGKKFKKCCVSRGVAIPNISNSASSEKIAVKTLTDEFFQPMRLYYTVHNKQAVEHCLKNTKCILHDEALNGWAVTYTAEAAKPQLKVPPNKVPREVSPLIIGILPVTWCKKQTFFAKFKKNSSIMWNIRLPMRASLLLRSNLYMVFPLRK